MESIKVIEPRVDITHDVQKNHLITYGGSRVQHNTETANSYQLSPAQPTQSSWSVSPPSVKTIVDRQIKIRSYFEVTCDQPHQLGTNDALRQLPLNSLIENTSVSINGQDISDTTSDKLHALMCYDNDADARSRSISTSTAMPDSYQEYSDWTTLGSNRNPLADYGENASEPSRGGFVYEVVSPTVFRCVVTEPLMLSPFLSGLDGQDEGFVNVNQMNVKLRFRSDVSQVLSHSSAGNAITSVGLTQYQAPELLVTYITPNMTQEPTESQVLPYIQNEQYIRSVPSLAAGLTTTVISDTITLSQIPSRLFLFVRHARASSNYATSDSFLAINNVNLQFDNQTLLGSATKQDLFEMSASNGCNLSYPAWSKYRGSVLCLAFGKDIGLPEDLAPGCQGRFQIQVSMTVENTGANAFVGEFFQIYQNQGTLTIKENGMVVSLGNLSRQLVYDTWQRGTKVSYAHYRALSGGGFFSSLKHIVNKVARGFQSAAPFIEKGLGIVAPELLPAFGVAKGAAGVARKFTGGSLSGGRAVGGRLSGGRMRRR